MRCIGGAFCRNGNSGNRGSILMLPVNIYYCLRKLHIKPVIETSIALIKMLGFSVFVFIGSIVDMLFWATDKDYFRIFYPGVSLLQFYNVWYF